MMTKMRRILAAVDGSATSDKALTAALELARDNAGCVRLIHAVEQLAYAAEFDYTGQAVLIAREIGQKVLQDALAKASAAGVDADTELVDHPGQRVGEAVAEAARDWKADVIVVGTHGRRGVGRVLLGSGAEQIFRLSPVPVLVIHASSK